MKKKLICLIFLLHFFPAVYAQYKVTFTVKDKSYFHHDSIFISGSFNNWDPSANPLYLLKSNGKGDFSTTLNFKPGTIQYKFHRGSWASVEKKSNGDEVLNRKLTIRKDTSVFNEISTWRDVVLQDKWTGLRIENADTSKLRITNELAFAYVNSLEFYNFDSALFYAGQSWQLLEKLKTVGYFKDK